MTSISSLAFKHENSEIDYSHLKNSNGFVESSNFDFYTAILPYGFEPAFDNFSEFLAFLNYYQMFYPSILRPKSLSYSIFNVLGVCYSYPFIFLSDDGAESYV